MAELQSCSLEVEKVQQPMDKFTALIKSIIYFVSAAGAVLLVRHFISLVFIPMFLQMCSNSMILFFLCNVIVLTLTSNSGLWSNSSGVTEDLYNKFTKINEMEPNLCEEKTCCGDDDPHNICGENDVGSCHTKHAPSNLDQTSSNVVEETAKWPVSETVDISRTQYWEDKYICSSKSIDVDADGKEEMIDDELNKRVEDFIAKMKNQMRLQRHRE
eukprot:Gb_15505 [translate_table: standard]